MASKQNPWAHSPSNLEPFWVMLDRFMLPKESTARLERAALELFLKPNQTPEGCKLVAGTIREEGRAGLGSKLP